MPGLQLSGLASGFDWKSVVDQLIAIERVPQDKLRTEKSTNTNRLSVFSSLRSRLTSLQTAVNTLKSDSSFGKRTATFDDTDTTWSATAGSGTQAGAYTFNVSTIATRASRAGNANVGQGLASTADVSGLVVSEMQLSTPVSAGKFTVNGAQVEVAETDTLQDVFDKIGTATGGDVTASYDASTDKITLQSASLGEIVLGSSSDTSNFLYALKLYNNGTDTVTSSGALGTTNIYDSIASAGLTTAISAVDGDGNGSFTINGVTIDYNVNDDSLKDVMDRVNASDAGVTMGFDIVEDRFTLTNKNTGDLGLAVSESAGGLLGAVGLTSGYTTNRGVNAVFTLNNGGTIVSASNTLDEDVHGITGLTVTAKSTGTQTVNVASDTSSLDSGIRAFLSAFNSIQTYIDDQTKVSVGSDGKVTSGLMAGNREFTAMARELRSMVFDEVPGLTGTIRRLEAIGIDFEGSSSQLTVRDETKLANALSDDLEGVTALFTTASDGLSARLDSYITQLTQTGGSIDSQEDSIERQNSSLDKQIADIERRLETERNRLEESFIRMEEAQSQIQSQLTALQQTLNF